MGLWRSESSPGKQWAMTLASMVVGIILIVGFRGFRVAGSNAVAGFMLGLLLLMIGIVGLLYTGKQVVIVDPKNRRITVEDSSAFSSNRRLIPFDTIEEIGIGYLGKASNHVTFYYLILKLKGDETYPLFAPGRFFPGSSDRTIVEGWRHRLQQCMNT